ncbi:MAG: hypothetical protein R3234_03445 [Thermoanaerobaculia bacterium]|nr:hypothetical protein [Thermoanaerobaculia bacterium]
MIQSCINHPESVAGYECDGCGESLCFDCVEESRALLLCTLCGERALPLASEAPATVRELQAHRRREAGMDYGLRDAFLYPFRGSGLFLFFAALISLAFVTGIRAMGSMSIGCLAWAISVLLWLGWIALLVGIQFKIVETTVDWEDELPDWPEYYSFGERLVELLTFLVIAGLQYGPALVYLSLFGWDGLATTEPSLPFWLGFALCLWLGTALSFMAWGAAGVHWRHLSLRVDKHVQGLFATGGEGLLMINLTFLLLGLVFWLRGALGDSIPLLGAALAGTLGIYWAFLLPHLVGLLFRRNRAELHRIYEGGTP